MAVIRGTSSSTNSSTIGSQKGMHVPGHLPPSLPLTLRLFLVALLTVPPPLVEARAWVKGRGRAPLLEGGRPHPSAAVHARRLGG